MKKTLLLLLSGMLFMPFASAANVLIEIDTSNPSAVVFRATTAPPDVTHPEPGAPFYATTNASMGIAFFDFLSIASVDDTDGSFSGDLAPAEYGAAEIYFLWSAKEGSNTLGISNGSLGGVLQKFPSTESPAFVGSGTADLSSIVSLLPAQGSTGILNLGLASTPDTQIGQWKVVPEPSTTFLAGIAFLLCATHRRRKEF